MALTTEDGTTEGVFPAKSLPSLAPPPDGALDGLGDSVISGILAPLLFVNDSTIPLFTLTSVQILP